MLAAVLLASLALQTPVPQAEFDALWNAGRRLEAIDALAAHVSRAPEPALRLRLAEAQLSVHWYAAALESLAPLGSEVDGLRGAALYKLGRYDEALALLDADDPEHVLMRVESLEALDRERELSAALELAERALGADDPRVLGYRGRAHARAGDLPAAMAAFERALERDPWDAAALFGLGRARIDAGERETGLALLERHRELAPKLDRLDFARRSLDLAPLHGANHAVVGDAERALGRSGRARSAYERGLELPVGVEAVPIALRLARLLVEDLDDLDAALGVLEEVGRRTRDARPWVRAGDLLLAAGRPLDAVQRFYQARDLRPGDAAIEKRIEAARAGYRSGDGR